MLYNTTGVSKMQQWNKFGKHQVNEFLDHDPEFMALLAQQRDAEKEYLRIMEKLNEQDRQIMEYYILLCEELEYKRTVTAYKCGLLHRKQ